MRILVRIGIANFQKNTIDKMDQRSIVQQLAMMYDLAEQHRYDVVASGIQGILEVGGGIVWYYAAKTMTDIIKRSFREGALTGSHLSRAPLQLVQSKASELPMILDFPEESVSRDIWLVSVLS